MDISQSKLYTIEGTVSKNSVSGNTLDGVEVQVDYNYQNSDINITTKTDNTGYYKVRLPKGNYNFKLLKDNYETKEIPVTVSNNNISDLNQYLREKLSFTLVVSKYQNGEIEFRDNDSKVEANYSIDNNNNKTYRIDCFYDDKIQIYAKAKQGYFIFGMSNKNQFKWVKEGIEAKWEIDHIKQSVTFSYVQFDELTSIDITYKKGKKGKKDEISKSPDGNPFYGTLELINDNKFTYRPDISSLYKIRFYPVISGNTDSVIRTGYGEYQFIKDGKVKVSFFRDVNPPVLSISGNSTIPSETDIKGRELHTNKPVDVYLDVQDNESGINQVSYDIDDSSKVIKPPYMLEIAWKEYRNILEGTLIPITAVDNTENKKELNLRIFYETLPPEIESVSVNSATAQFKQKVQEQKILYVMGQPSLDVIATDNFGKLKNIRYYVSDKADMSTTELNTILNREEDGFVSVDIKQCDQQDNRYTFSLDEQSLKDGDNYVYITAEDLCGNIQTENYGCVHFRRDNNAPRVSPLQDVSAQNGIWKKPTDIIKIAGSISDEDTPGGLSYAFKVTESTGEVPSTPTDSEFIRIGDVDSDNTSYKFEQLLPQDLKQDGSYFVWVWAKDGCGNICDKPVSYLYHVDGTNPNMYDFSFDVKENGNIAQRVFQRIFGFFFNQKEIDNKLETVNLKLKASDIVQTGYTNNEKPELTDIALYYTTVNDEDVKSFIESISQNNAMPTFENSQVKDVSDNVNCEYSFELKIPQNEKFYSILFVARDKAGNLSYMVPPTKDIPYLIMVDQTAPALNFELQDGFKTPDYINGNKNWYSAKKEVTYNIDATDSGSGLFKSEFKANGKDLTSQNHNYYEDIVTSGELVPSDSYKIGMNTEGAKIADDGHYTFEAKMTDNSGNVALAERTIYVDLDRPVITNISFKCNGVETEAEKLYVKEDQYGYYFLKDTEVYITATDYIYNGAKEPKKYKNKEIAGSGIRDLTYHISDVDEKNDGKKNVTKTISVKPIGGGKYTANFTIPAGFRGQISVFATDNVGQKSKVERPKGSVIESRQNHINKYSTTSVSIPQTKYKDAEGNPLYNYKPSVSFFTEDRKSGISDVIWKIKAHHMETEEDGKKLTVQSDYDPNTNKWVSKLTGDHAQEWKSSLDERKKNTKDALSDLNLVRYLSRKHQILYEENHITASLLMTDNVGNKDYKATKKVFSVDTTAPKITVEYDNNDVYNEKYYKKERNATITVEDANFSETDCVITTTGDGVEIGKWTHAPGGGCDGKVHSKNCKWQCVVSFVQDGDYTFAFKCKDLAGWESSYEKVDEFTIDKTNPKIHVDYNNNDVANGSYYKEARTATVHIEEHNFRSEDVKITMTATDGGKQIAVPSVSGWSSNDDDRTATIQYDYDGSFTFDVDYTDLADNDAEDYPGDSFTVDLTEPKIEITGVQDKAAYNGNVIPVISCTDTNADNTKNTITLTGYNRGKVSIKPVSSSIPGGYKFTLEDIPHKKDMDDIYTLEVKMEDKAGNTSEQTVMYSLNRFGSNYYLSDATSELIKKGYINEPQDVVLTEVNVGKLASSTITYTRDGDVVSLNPVENYSVKESGGGDSWTTYEYNINADNFDKEGRYVVSVMSVDAAGNVTDNKVKDANIEFTMDHTPPSTVISGVSDKGQYTDSTRTITLNVADNIGVDKVMVYSNDELIASFDRWEIEEKNGDLSVVLNSSKEWQTIKIVTLDVAGNEMTSEEMRVLLTKNLFVQWYKNRVLFFASVITVVLIIAALVLLFSKKKKKQQIMQEQK